MEAWSQFVQLLFSGLTVGSIYALVALGFVITYSVTGILNLAQGDFAMLGALFCITLVNNGVPFAAAIGLSMLAVMVVGGLFERLAIQPARRSPVAVLIIITIGASFVFRGIALLVWGTDPYALRPFTGHGALEVFGAVIQWQSVWAIVISLASFAALHLFFHRTYIGKAVAACVINPFAARLMGIDIRKMSLGAIAVSAGLGALAGIVIAPISGASYDMGMMIGLKAFIAAVVGGLTNAPAAIAGAFLVGLLESFAEGYLSSGYKEAISFGLLLLVLFFMPNGLFAKMTGKRV
ncbi:MULTISPECIES: branched-chain amino acid ABC transporter permease [Geobacillus]|uniref:Branched amino acid ABC transporter (Permease) n=5 Tax=Geobacillus TaxID=129337 RepID=Q5KVH6_GEOKA|nr:MULTISPECIES: branched-chain amino acid ABC transporter permease [Geobacillus]KDE46136.1 ABC transporter permease [Geobacillus sp. CAMR12739]AEV20686.1 Inner-membrane translocator [Geobacillus thermoleovorans CCB_US3_UF5]AUI37294.1 branched-chain amino acid ABC transporter permease [[Bacillus] caldolyticus]MED3665969.1 branched-chain amino acid ABC transporter permease [Geobacillus kaustophilus]ODA17952.1 ABC transporter permease [Geobacillus thermoleovorans]